MTKGGLFYLSTKVKNGQTLSPIEKICFTLGRQSGSILAPFGVRFGSVRDPFGICPCSVWGLFGVRSGSVRGPLGIRSGQFRTKTFGAKISPRRRPHKLKNFGIKNFLLRKFWSEIGLNETQTDRFLAVFDRFSRQFLKYFIP